YLTVGGDAANLMFQVVNERYLHHRPMLFTTNKPLAAWGLVLHDPDLAEAILDRVLERGRLVELRGASYRTRHLKRAEPGRSPLREGARISGNQGPDFPEPTALSSVRPGLVLAGSPVELEIDGRNFVPSMWVALQSGQEQVRAARVVVLSSTQLTATINVPSSMRGRLDLLAGSPLGSANSLAGGIVALGDRSLALMQSLPPDTASGVSPP